MYVCIVQIIKIYRMNSLNFNLSLRAFEYNLKIAIEPSDKCTKQPTIAPMKMKILTKDSHVAKQGLQQAQCS